MGLIRKALSVSTLGGVKYTSRREAETKERLANARLAKAQAGTVSVCNPCWCCGGDCMFCDGTDSCGGPHWCSPCKFGACLDCCGCGDCRINGRAGWTPAGRPRVSHGEA
jgi:hypothetical protein